MIKTSGRSGQTRVKIIAERLTRSFGWTARFDLPIPATYNAGDEVVAVTPSKKSFDAPILFPTQHRRTFMKRAVLTAIAPLVMAQEVHRTSNTNPFVGTWKLNLAKSKFDPGPPVRSRTVTIEALGEDAVKWSIDQVDADGNHATVVEMPRFDGKDYPRTVSVANAPDTIALKRLDAYTLEETVKKNGTVVATYKQVVSKDGKTRTATQTSGTNARGQAVHDVIVFDRQ